jgi:hypothetical protein
VAAEGVELAEDLLLEPGVFGGRVHLDAGIEARRENHAVRERRAKASGDREPILGIETVLVVAAKRQLMVP